MALTRIFFTSDVHGSDICFMKFLNAAKAYKANVLILGGDITGKVLVPIAKNSNGTYTAQYGGKIQVLNSDQELEAFQKNLRSGGSYPYLATRDELQRMETDRGFVDEIFAKAMSNAIRRWMGIAEERLRGTETRCYISPGNDDNFFIDEALSSSNVIVNPEDRVVRVDDHHEMITSGWVSPTPWNSPREVPEEQLYTKLETMVNKVENMKNCIFNFHCPPFDTPLDLAPALDATLKPISSGGGIQMIHVGSKSVRSLIEKYQPLVGLHGHIHESRGFVKIGKTICINPGSEYGEGILRGSLVNIDEKGLKSHLLTQG
jgi:Icc-related predicted phosphoesterase